MGVDPSDLGGSAAVCAEREVLAGCRSCQGAGGTCWALLRWFGGGFGVLILAGGVIGGSGALAPTLTDATSP